MFPFLVIPQLLLLELFYSFLFLPFVYHRTLLTEKRGTSIILIVRMMPVLSHSVSVVSEPLWSNRLQPPGFSVHGNTPGKNTAMGCHTVLQGIFLTHGWNRDLLHYRRFLYQLSYQGMLSAMTVIPPATITCLENFVLFNVHNTCVLMNLFIIRWFFSRWRSPLRYAVDFNIEIKSSLISLSLTFAL